MSHAVPEPVGANADVTTDPHDERAYRAAVQGVALFERGARGRLRVSGRAPRQMLDGIVTGALPAPARPGPDGHPEGRATYHAVLTPKGKMITDCWAYLTGADDAEGFLLDVPATGIEGFLAHLAKFLPPRLARVQDVGSDTDMIAVVGPEAPSLLSRLVFGLRLETDALAGMEEGEWRMAGPAPDSLIVCRTAEVLPLAYLILGEAGTVDAARRRLLEAGAVPAGPAVWTTLRVEAGRPEFGVDMTDATIPVEAGIHLRAIDYQKGCYTGQEVIVRIRDRGHVNRHLRHLRIVGGPVLRPGAELVSVDDGKAAGSVTSSVRAPGSGEVVLLAYVRRGVEHVSSDGREVLPAVP